MKSIHNHALQIINKILKFLAYTYLSGMVVYPWKLTVMLG